MFEQVVTLDFESRSACDLKKAGAWTYSEHPTTEVLCLWFCWRDGRTERWLPGEPMPSWLPIAIEGGVVFECHNSLFERGMWTNVMSRQWGWPEIPPEQWHDTLAVCARKAIPLDLETASKLLGLTVKKNVEGSTALMKICKPISKTRFEFNEDPKLLEIVTGDYGRDDTLSQMHLSKRLGYLEPSEREVWLLNQRMNLRGLQVDMNFAADCQAVYDKATTPIARTFAEITDNMKPASPKLKGFLNEMLVEDGCNASFPDMKKETVEEALKDWDISDRVRSIVEMRSALTSASVKKLAAMRACVSSDGRARGLIQYHAATTGRDGGRLLQPQNFPRGSVELGKDLDGNAVPPWDFLVPAIQSRDAAFIGASLAHLEEHISPEFRELLAPVSAVTSALRHCIVAGKGKVLCAGDFSTIEVRVLLGIAGQHDKLKMIADGLDPYLDFASDVMGKRMEDKKLYAKERQEIGKPGVLGCFGAGTPVLTRSGWKAIETIKDTDWLWDGEEWTRSAGAVDQGEKETLTLGGCRVTPDHKIWSGRSWLPALSLARDPSIMCRALETALAPLLSPHTTWDLEAAHASSKPSVIAEIWATSLSQASVEARLLRAIAAQNKKAQQLLKNTGATLTSYLTTQIENACSTASRHALIVVKTPGARATADTESGASECGTNGEKELKGVAAFWHIWSRLMAGATPLSTSTASTIMKDTSPEISASSLKQRMQRTEELLTQCRSKSTNSERVYDIAHAGERNRFTILTEFGPLIVHNCGFQMGADKLWRKDGKGRWGIETAQRIIDTYRKDWAPEVPKLWYGLQEASTKAVWDRRPQEYNGIRYALEEDWLTCRLPSGRKLYYFNPRKTKRHMPWSTEEKPDIREGWSYVAKKQGKLVTVDAYGGQQTENVVQATARDIMYDRALVADAEGLPLVLTVHDENVTEPDAGRQDAKTVLQQIMEDAPAWARQLGIPIAAEVWVGDRYRK